MSNADISINIRKIPIKDDTVDINVLIIDGTTCIYKEKYIQKLLIFFSYKQGVSP